MGEQQQLFQNLLDELKAMDQIEELKVPSDGRFMANYNDRNKFGKNKTEEMEEERLIDREFFVFETRSGVEKKKAEAEKEEMEEENKDMTKREDEGDYRAWFTNPDWSSPVHRPKKNSNLNAEVLTKAKSKEELDKTEELKRPQDVKELTKP